MEFRESETVELKQEYTEGIRKEIVAMANTIGGSIYLGIADDGTVIGLENPDETIQRITNSVRDAIKPDVTMFLQYQTLEQAGRQIVSVQVQCGVARPYYLAAKGLRPEGVYVRQGTSSVPASEAMIRRMIKETDGDTFEDMRSLTQSLTFAAATAEFAARNVRFDLPQMKTLGIVGIDGIYTNLGLLLSDQCPHVIKAATFGGVTQEDFQDRREFNGSLLKQLNEAYAYLDLRNKTHATFQGLYRVDRQDYPRTALREALLNAIVHRDYAFSASTLVSVYTDRMEMMSIGGLARGVSLEDVLMGLSVCRNQKLANIFYRLNLIEAYGTGMRKIQSAYQDNIRKPDIQATGNAFKITLPILAVPENGIVGNRYANEADAILDVAHANGSITRKKAEEVLGVGTATASRLLKRMVEEKYLTVVGKGPTTRYLPT